MEQVETNEVSKKHWLISLFIFLVILIGSIIAYARYVSTTGLEVIENGISDTELPASFNGFKIVTIADIHYGKTTSLNDVKKIIKRVNSLKPDVIVFLGDLFDNEIKISNNDIELLKKEFAKLDASISKYAVKGDNDYNNITDFETIFKYSDFNILDNTNDMLYYKGNIPIKFVGTTSLLKSKIDYDSAFKQDDKNEYFTILLSHEPNVINNIKGHKVNVMFTAHSMGGLINIPFIGGVFKFKGSDNYLKGEYDINNTKMYVNSGIGTYKYNFRWFNRPSINLYRMYNK